MSQRILVGVDGGGTHTRARLADLAGSTLASAHAGSSNVSINGFENAQREILSAIERALRQAEFQVTDIAAMCLGVSGVDTVLQRDQFLEWSRRHFDAPILVVNDVELVLAAGTPEAWGIALIAGTGSIAFAKTRAGQTARAGGWGYIIGDEGSGGELGRSALHAAVQAADGRGAPTRLLDDILAQWQLSDAFDLLDMVYRSRPGRTPLLPADFAALAPLVLTAADEGDAVAAALVSNTALRLADHAVALANRLDFPLRSVPLALGGGLVVGSPRIRAELVSDCAARGISFSSVGLVPEPVAGAIALAQRLVHPLGEPDPYPAQI